MPLESLMMTDNAAWMIRDALKALGQISATFDASELEQQALGEVESTLRGLLTSDGRSLK